MESGIFTDQQSPPSEEDLANKLGDAHEWLKDIVAYLHTHCPVATEEWNFSKGFGWNLRVKDKKRVLIYIMPCDKFFKASFVLGAKATDLAMSADISQPVKETISTAKVYAEGRGFRIDVKKKNIVKDIRKLIDIKLAC